MENSNSNTTMNRGNNLNTIKLKGTIAGNVYYSHSIVRKVEDGNINIAFFSFTLEVPRLSGVSDFLEIIIPEKMWSEIFYLHECKYGERFYEIAKVEVEILGRIQSHNRIDLETDKNKLDLSVFARTISIFTTTMRYDAKDNLIVTLPKKSLNKLTIEGFLCKTPVIRQTPLGKTIADLFIAVNRHSGTAYIPVILWGGNAINVKNFKIGDKLRLEGRFQSREYTKDVNGTINTRTVYEVSASKVKLVE